MQKYDHVIFIGRFQPPHRAHIEIIRQAIDRSNHSAIVLIGSSGQPRTIKNPWSFEQRKAMILASLPKSLHRKVKFVAIHDIPYNDNRWVQHVQDAIYHEVPSSSSRTFALIGHSKDSSSYYLSMFPQWDLIDVDNIDDINATDIRMTMFEYPERFEKEFIDKLPKEIYGHLNAFMLTPEFDTLREEYQHIENYRKGWQCAPYPPTFVTVDAIVIQSGHIIIVKRRSYPGKGLWALPGGFVGQDETIEQALIRELKEETKIKVPPRVLVGSIKKSAVYDFPQRSLRGRTITHGFLIELPPGELPKIKGGDDAQKAQWIPLSVFSQMEDQLFEDHYHIVDDLIGGIQ